MCVRYETRGGPTCTSFITLHRTLLLHAAMGIILWRSQSILRLVERTEIFGRVFKFWGLRRQILDVIETFGIGVKKLGFECAILEVVVSISFRSRNIMNFCQFNCRRRNMSRGSMDVTDARSYGKYVVDGFTDERFKQS
jgi:hypothetical protein